MVQGALRVSAELAPLADTWAGAHRQVLARLHALAALGPGAEPTQLGRPRPDREVAHRLDTLAEVLALTSAPAVVVAAIVQAELLSLDAFAPASGVVARAAARLTLIDRGLDPKSLVPFEVGHLELRDGVRGGAGRLRDRRRRTAVVGWIAHCRPGGRARRPGVAGDLRGDPARLIGLTLADGRPRDMGEGAVPEYGALCGQTGYQACTCDMVRRGPVTVRVDSLQRGVVAAWVPGCPLADPRLVGADRHSHSKFP